MTDAENSIFDDPCTCESCGSHGDRINTLGQVIYKQYDGELLCSSCRVDRRLADGDFET